MTPVLSWLGASDVDSVNLLSAAVKLMPGAVDLMRSSLTSASMARAALPGESRQQAAVPCASDWLSHARRGRRSRIHCRGRRRRNGLSAVLRFSGPF